MREVIDVKKIRADFPILKRKVNNKPLIYFDNAATSHVAYAWGRKNIKKGDEILLTQMEHHSNLVPWQILAGEVGAKLKFIPIDKNGELRIKNRALRALQPFHGLEELIPPRTKLVGITHVSNVLGTINSVKKIIEQIKNLDSRIKL